MRAARIDAWLDDWARLEPDAEKIQLTNPGTSPRDHVPRAALDAAKNGDLSPFHEMLEAVGHTFEEWIRYAVPTPSSAGRFVSTCGT